MTAAEKTRLIQLLQETHRETASALAEVDLGTVLHPDTGWRVRDIVAHLAAWEIEAAAALRAAQRGERHTIAEKTIDAFNDRAYEQRKDLPVDQVYAEWEAAHADFVAALEETPPDLFEARITLPWRARGTVNLLIEGMALHEVDHRDEIARTA